MSRRMFEHMTTVERIQAAKAKTDRVVDHLLYLLALHENNAVIVYSDTLSSQIPLSRAANAFNVFQAGLHQFEIVRLCALWDRPSADRESIPTIVELIDCPEIIETLAQEEGGQWGGNGGVAIDLPEGTSPELSAIIIAEFQRHEEKFGQERVEKARDGLRKAIDDARRISSSPMLTSIMNLRHTHLAHSLAQKRIEKEAEPVAPMKYGDERKILLESFSIAEALLCWISHSGFTFTDSQEIARKNAAALWKHCTFDIQR